MGDEFCTQPFVTIPNLAQWRLFLSLAAPPGSDQSGSPTTSARFALRFAGK